MSLTPAQVESTADWICSIQLPSGMIPWFPGGHADPWNHVEAAMALVLSGRNREAERAFEWLRRAQQVDGSWCLYYLAEGVEEPRRDPNVCAYVATGAWWYYLISGDRAALEEMWPVVDGAIGFSLTLQQPGGEVLWSMEPDGTPGRFALLTGSSSILHSLRCGVAVAEALGYERPEWELAAGRLAHAIAHREDTFEPKQRWAMDWYYPVLSGAVAGESGARRLAERWDEFVMEGLGVRCVADRPWVTGAETAECAMALDSAGQSAQAAVLLSWTDHLRDRDGAYWTGCVHPECIRFPGGERTTYTAAAVLLANHVLHGDGPAAGLFRGHTLPAVLDLAEVEEPVVEG
jgi:hypothetical protein